MDARFDGSAAGSDHGGHREHGEFEPSTGHASAVRTMSAACHPASLGRDDWRNVGPGAAQAPRMRAFGTSGDPTAAFGTGPREPRPPRPTRLALNCSSSCHRYATPTTQSHNLTGNTGRAAHPRPAQAGEALSKFFTDVRSRPFEPTSPRRGKSEQRRSNGFVSAGYGTSSGRTRERGTSIAPARMTCPVNNFRKIWGPPCQSQSTFAIAHLPRPQRQGSRTYAS